MTNVGIGAMQPTDMTKAPGPQFNAAAFGTNIFGQPVQGPQTQFGKMLTGQAPPPPSTYGVSSQGNSLLNQLWQTGLQGAAAQQQGISGDILNQQQKESLALANQQMQTGYINSGDALSRQRIGIQMSDLGNQQAALARQSPLAAYQHQLALDAFNEQSRQALFGSQQQGRALTSQGTTSGNLQSQGARQGFGDIAQQLAFSNENIGRNVAGENLSYTEKQAQLKDQKSQLDNAAKSIGIDSQELTNRTQQALQQLGLSTALTVNDVTKAINDLNAGRYNPIQKLLGQIYSVSGVRAVA